MNKKAGKIFVGMSGGVDSSVSAALLKEEGYDVVGVFIKVWSPEWMPCTWPEERRDAMRVAAHLGIPFITLDLADEYKKGVADYMIEEYRKGRTPNPDVMCNKEVKFGSFYDKAMKEGADFVATGHYARTENGFLKKGIDQNKDQSYFIWNIKKEQIDKIKFPIGDLEKTEVRKLAKKFNIPVADKKDSQGVCFLGKLDMKEFLSHYIDKKEGDVLNEPGDVIGKHDGAFFYTFGQRHGFLITEKGDNDKPVFIVGKNIEENTITVSEDRVEDVLDIKEVELEDLNWISSPEINKTYTAKVRYRQEDQECQLISKKRILFKESQTISPGQSVVLYDGDKCLGGGVIK